MIWSVSLYRLSGLLIYLCIMLYINAKACDKKQNGYDYTHMTGWCNGSVVSACARPVVVSVYSHDTNVHVRWIVDLKM